MVEGAPGLYDKSNNEIYRRNTKKDKLIAEKAQDPRWRCGALMPRCLLDG